ncbi:MAG: hypothetical protein KJ579_01310, partial [Verrucomicrobia bacterium]|nr:hypothetical protein [Verrucomicrobiota bacterium]
MRVRTLAILVGLVTCTSHGAGTTPVPLESRLLEPTGRGIGSLETIRILTRWDSAGYRITADMRGLDGGAGGAPAVYDSANGSYVITYTTAAMTDLPDAGGIVLPITAAHRGDTTSAFTDRSLIVCRNVHALTPGHRGSLTRDGRSRFAPGESLVVRSR